MSVNMEASEKRLTAWNSDFNATIKVIYTNNRQSVGISKFIAELHLLDLDDLISLDLVVEFHYNANLVSVFDSILSVLL